MRESKGWLAVMLLAVLSAGCAGSLVVRSALTRAALGAAVRGAVAPRLVAAGSGSLLRGALVGLTLAGSVRPTISIDRLGRIQHAGRHLATLERNGDLVIRGGVGGERAIIGRVAEGRIWEIGDDGKLASPIGRISATLRGNRASLKAGPFPSESTVEVLREGVTAELLQVSGHWYEVRLLNGRVGWVWGPLLALGTVLFSTDEDGDARPRSGARLTLRSGDTLWLRESGIERAVVPGIAEDGKAVAVDSSLVKWSDPADEEIGVDWASDVRMVKLRNGTTLISDGCRKGEHSTVISLFSGESGESFKLVSEPGEQVVVDTALVTGGC